MTTSHLLRYTRHILATATLLAFVGLIVAFDRHDRAAKEYRARSEECHVLVQLTDSSELGVLEDTLADSTSQPVRSVSVAPNTYLIQVRCLPGERSRLLEWLLDHKNVNKADLVDD